MRRAIRIFTISAAELLLALYFVSFAGAQQIHRASAHATAPNLGLEQILTNLEERNAQRASELQQLESKRIYRMRYHGFFRDRNAEMVVKVHFCAPNSKQFTVISQTGSSFVIDHVFKKLLEAEQEAIQRDNGRNIALSRENYDFTLVGSESTPEGPRYILDLIPKTKNKYLYRGRIWVDAHDFAVVRIEGQPNRNPSMWISKTDFAHTYTKVGDFWLPAQNYTESSVRLGGKSTLSIEYRDYKITTTPPLHISETATIDGAALPPPAND